MSPKLSRLLLVSLLLVTLSLVACSSQPAISSVVAVTQTRIAGETKPPFLGVTSTSTEIALSPSATPTPPQNDTQQVVIRSYHTLLMLERADDLMLTAIQKIQAGELPPGDAAPRFVYTDAFPVAIEELNQTTPPPGILNTAWENVTRATQQYNLVYAALIQGKVISNNDLVSLRMIRQLLTNYQNYAEGYLKQKSLGPEYFASERQAVEVHFQKSYGETPMPTLAIPPTPFPLVTPKKP